MKECSLELHPEKTKIVYCKDKKRTGHYDQESFDFLGYTFRPRRASNGKGPAFVGFNPAISGKAAKDLRREIRRWHIGRRSDKSLSEIADFCNAKVRGWIQYFGLFNRSALKPTLREIERDLVQWAQRKFKGMRRKMLQAIRWLAKIAGQQPSLFEHWKFGLQSKVVAQ